MDTNDGALCRFDELRRVRASERMRLVLCEPRLSADDGLFRSDQQVMQRWMVLPPWLVPITTGDCSSSASRPVRPQHRLSIVRDRRGVCVVRWTGRVS